MGCANGKVSPTGEIMLRADGTVRTLTDEQSKAQMLKAQESAKRLADMMAELGLQEGGEYKLIGDTALVPRCSASGTARRSISLATSSRPTCKRR